MARRPPAYWRCAPYFPSPGNSDGIMDLRSSTPVPGLRSFLFSKWFFAILFVVSVFDVAADIAERLRSESWVSLNSISLGLSLVVAILAGWMFLDLNARRPR